MKQRSYSNFNGIWVSLRFLRRGTVFFLSFFLCVLRCNQHYWLRLQDCVVAVLWMHHNSVNGGLYSWVFDRQIQCSLRNWKHHVVVAVTKWHCQFSITCPHLKTQSGSLVELSMNCLLWTCGQYVFNKCMTMHGLIYELMWHIINSWLWDNKLTSYLAQCLAKLHAT